MDINDILVPINKTAALVTNQSGCDKNTKYMSLVSSIENIKLAIKSAEDFIKASDDKKKKKEAGRRKCELQEMLRPLKAELKTLNIHHRETINSLIIRECMKMLSDDEWREIVSRANAKFRADEI